MSEGSDPHALGKDLLPYRPRPFPDELFSSWLFRMAHGHGMRLREFSRVAFGHAPKTGVCDLDRKVDDRFLEAISLKTAIPYAQLFRATLRSYEGALFEKMTRSGTVKWILPIGVNRNYGERFGFQFCPLCLSSDRNPYYRRHWRLAFVTACSLHKCLLGDRCPHCAAPVNPVRSEIALPLKRIDANFVTCFQCGNDLRAAQGGIRASRRFLLYQKSLICLAEKGGGRVFGVDFNYAHLFFDVFFRILQMLLSPAIGRVGDYVRKVSQIPFTVKILPVRGSFRFVLLDVRDRHETLDAGFWILSGWPASFLRIVRGAGVSHSSLKGKARDLPFWYTRVLKDLIPSHSYQATQEEVEAAIRYLEAKEAVVNILEVRRLVGQVDSGRVRRVLAEKGYRREIVEVRNPKKWNVDRSITET